MSAADDIVDGVVCMQCGTFFIASYGDACSFGFPVLCEGCWRELPACEQNGVAYFDAKSGELHNG